MRAQLKCMVQKIGGEEVPVFVRLALKQIVSDELAINLTWRGTSEKPSIQNFAVFSIIKDVCHSKFQNSTDYQINKIVQQHFLHARDRVLKRKLSSENTRGNLRLSN
ncbi:PREDICTED: uncharacterized protein LOC108374999 [Rhagoletis zephyria]|uniref:uncharacterized protein LOC108374999 n=1 Tax=Rhagoletis zephyria TaxID=28612 RepID=UPI0008119B79|nr:PREDICTED: uncharacterized protein LOC108374999 [Rhagoletis zephyria]